MSNDLTTTKDQLKTLLDGIRLGRTFHDLEKQVGMSAEQLLLALAHDEDLYLRFKTVRETSAYVIEDEITTKLRDNAEAPESAVKNNALKIWADHMHWAAERRNPAIFSGKAAVNVTVPIQIHTDIDLNQPKNVEGIYELEAIHVEETKINDIQDSDPRIELVDAGGTPFSQAILGAALVEVANSEAEEAQVPRPEETAGPEQAVRHSAVGERQPPRPSDVQPNEAAPVPRKKSGSPRNGARKNAPKRGRAQETAT